MTGSATSVSPIRLAYAVSDADQRAALRAIVMAEPRVRWTRIVLLVLPVVMVAWSLASGWPLGVAFFRNAFWIVLALLGLFAYVPWTVGSVVKGIRRADPDWGREQVVTLDDRAIRLESAAERTEVPWSAVLRATETHDIVLIYIGAARVLYLPLRIVAAQSDPSALRALLRARIGTAGSLGEGTFG